MQIQFQERRIYLDMCSIGRSLDNQAQKRIRRETEAVETIVDYFFTGQLYWVASKVLAIEIANNPHLKKREATRYLLNSAHEPFWWGQWKDEELLILNHWVLSH